MVDRPRRLEIARVVKIPVFQENRKGPEAEMGLEKPDPAVRLHLDGKFIGLTE